MALFCRRAEQMRRSQGGKNSWWLARSSAMVLGEPGGDLCSLSPSWQPSSTESTSRKTACCGGLTLSRGSRTHLEEETRMGGEGGEGRGERGEEEREERKRRRERREGMREGRRRREGREKEGGGKDGKKGRKEREEMKRGGESGGDRREGKRGRGEGGERVEERYEREKERKKNMTTNHYFAALNAFFSQRIESRLSS